MTAAGPPAVLPDRQPAAGGVLFVALLLVGANLRAPLTAVGPVLDQVGSALSIDDATASLMVALPLLAFAVVSPLAPRLGAAIGTARAVGAALAALAVGVVVRSVPVAGGVWVGTLLLGAAIAVLNVLLPSIVRRDFPKRIGRATGAYSATQSAFAALAAGLAVPLAAAGGWRLSLGVWGVTAIGAFVLWLAVVRPRVDPRAPAGGAVALQSGPWSPWRSAIGWQVTVCMSAQSVVFYVLVTWLPTIERAGGVSAAAAGVDQTLLNVGSIGGSLACSSVLHRLRDPRPIAIVAPVFFLVAVLGTLLAPAAGAAWAAAAGIAAGSCLVLTLSLFGLRTRDHREAAALSGMAQTVGYLLAAAGPVVAGAGHEAGGSWSPVLVVLAILVGVEMIAGTLAARPRG